MKALSHPVQKALEELPRSAMRVSQEMDCAPECRGRKDDSPRERREDRAVSWAFPLGLEHRHPCRRAEYALEAQRPKKE